MKRICALVLAVVVTMLMVGGLALADEPIRRNVRIFYVVPGYGTTTIAIGSTEPITAELVSVVQLRAVDGTVLASQLVEEGCEPVEWWPEAEGQCGLAYEWAWDLSEFQNGQQLEEWMQQCWHTSVFSQPTCIAYAPPGCDIVGADCSFSLDVEGHLVVPEACYAHLVECGTRRDVDDFWYQGLFTGTGEYGRCLPLLRTGASSQWSGSGH